MMTRLPRVIGQTVVQRQGPPWGWTDAERAELALYLSGSVTDPAAKPLRPGSLMVWWAVGWTWPRGGACLGSGGMPRSRRSRRTARLKASPWWGRPEAWIVPPEVRQPPPARRHKPAATRKTWQQQSPTWPIGGTGHRANSALPLTAGPHGCHFRGACSLLSAPLSPSSASSRDRSRTFDPATRTAGSATAPAAEAGGHRCRAAAGRRSGRDGGRAGGGQRDEGSRLTGDRAQQR